jgi:Sad1 / UNC-like C-terminal
MEASAAQKTVMVLHSFPLQWCMLLLLLILSERLATEPHARVEAAAASAAAAASTKESSRGTAATSGSGSNSSSPNEWIGRMEKARSQAQKSLERYQKESLVVSEISKRDSPIAKPSKAGDDNDTDELQRDIQDLVKKRDALIEKANAQQLRELAAELKLRFQAAIRYVDKNHNDSFVVAAANNEKAAASDNETEDDDDLNLDRVLNARDILSGSEEVLTRWISRLMHQEVESNVQSSMDQIAKATEQAARNKQKQSSLENASIPASLTSSCVSAIQAATEVHAALIRYSGSGSSSGSGGQADHDYAASIVQSLTSPTYIPEPSSNEWSLSWLERYTPLDWQDAWSKLVVLRPEWSEMVLAGNDWWSRVQTSLWPQLEYARHSLQPLSRQRLSSLSAPPQAILQNSNYPGHCWPVAMRDQPHSSRTSTATGTTTASADKSRSKPLQHPHVTILLQQPLAQIDRIVVDHVATFFLAEPEVQLQSAPKRLKVYGYAPCSNGNDKACSGTGFDPSTSRLLTEIAYDIHAESNVQSFVIPVSSPSSADAGSAKSKTNASLQPDPVAPEMPTLNGDDAVHDSGSCSAVQTTAEPSCGAGGSGGGVSNDGPVAAITVEVVENWGNKNYTCLYGIRVHGEPVL